MPINFYNFPRGTLCVARDTADGLVALRIPQGRAAEWNYVFSIL